MVIYMNKNQRTMPDKIIIKKSLKYIYPYWKNFLLAFFLLLINVAIQVILPYIISDASEAIEAIKDNLTNNPMLKILILVSSYLLLSIINTIFQYIMSVVLQKTGQQIVVNLRNDVFNHIESLSTSQLNNIPVGKLVTRITNDTVALSDMFSNLIVKIVQNILLIITIFSVMFFVDWKLSLYMLIFVTLVGVISFIFHYISKKLFREERNQLSNMNSFLSENLSGMQVIQVYNQEDRIKKEFDKYNNKFKKASYNVMFAFAFYRPSVTLIYYLALATCFALGVPSLESNTFLLFYLYLTNFFEPIQQIADLVNGFQRGFAASERLFLLLEIKPLIVDDEDAITLDHFEGNIEFEHVYFAYEKERWILKDISFKINKGETVAFVGQTGAGKTTILSLIVRNYDIQKGHIYIDGIDIKKIKISSLRKHIGQMLQDVFLFSGTIKSNIKLRNEEISDEDVKTSCEYVNADRFINKLAKGYDQEVQENGSNFSNGERQLLSFARTIVRKPEILILDEATSNIDTENEVLIQDSLNKMKSIGTMLVVAHRLSTIKNADKIIVIENGQIIEEGNHEQLIMLHGYYYKLCNLL